MIQEERLIHRFQRLVATDNPTYQERQMCDQIKAELDDMKIPYIEDDAGSLLGGNCGNLYAYIEGSLELPPLLLSTHMDAVDPAIGKKAVLHEDGTITSDGSTVLGADDLGGISAILEAVHSILESGTPHRPIELLFSVAEETYCEGAKLFDFSKIRSREAYVLDLTGPIGTAAYKAPTILSFSATFTGRAAHAAFAPETGIHAIKAAADAIAQIPCGYVEDTTVNIGTIQGGSATNVVPESCIVTGEIRSFQDASARKQLRLVENRMKESAKKFGAEVTFAEKTLIQAYDVPMNASVVQRFRSACEQLSLPCRMTETFGGSDNNPLSQHGISGLVIASAMNSCHSCEEYTSVTDLMKVAELTVQLILTE